MWEAGAARYSPPIDIERISSVKKKKLSYMINIILGLTVVILGVYAWSLPKEPETVYIEVPQDPIIETVYVEVEKETDYKPYYQSVAESITQDEIDLVAQITWLESGNQSLTGQKAVVEVIFNRVLHDRFPDTIYEVLSQDGQFSTWPNRSIAEPTEQVYEAIRQVLNESETVLDKDVLFFSRSGFRDRQTYEKIGGHVFCY